jgi:zinc protease
MSCPLQAQGHAKPGRDIPRNAQKRTENCGKRPYIMDSMTLPVAVTVQSRVRTDFLSNGLKVVVQPIHTAPLVSVWCWYRVGSSDEMPGRTGVSHWVEHMNFKGTAHIPREEMKGIVERFGGMWNGYTWIDQTTFVETAGRAALDQMLFIEAERMAHGLYDAAECESERTVVISELQGGENDPDQLLDTEVTATAFRVHPYRHPTIGWLNDLQSMTRDDLYGHYRKFYIPNNATLVVVGDVDPDDVLRGAERHFGAIPSGSDPERIRLTEPPQLGERRVLVEREGTTGYVKVVFHAPAAAEQDQSQTRGRQGAGHEADGRDVEDSEGIPHGESGSQPLGLPGRRPHVRRRGVAAGYTAAREPGEAGV